MNVSLLNVPLILHRFNQVTVFFDTLTSTCFTDSLPHCARFSSALFWRHQNVLGVTDRTPGSSHFCLQFTEDWRNTCRLQSFLSQILYTFFKKSLWGELLILEKEKENKNKNPEKRHGRFIVFYPNLFKLIIIGNLGVKFAGRCQK